MSVWKLRVPQVVTASITLTETTGTLTWDVDTHGTSVLASASTGNLTLNDITNSIEGSLHTLVVTATGADRTLTLGSNFQKGLGAGQPSAVTIPQNDSISLSFVKVGTSFILVEGLPGAGINVWGATTNYGQGDTAVTPTGALVTRNTAGTSGATFDATEAADWTFKAHLETMAFVGSAYYYAGQEATEGVREMRVNTSLPKRMTPFRSVTEKKSSCTSKARSSLMGTMFLELMLGRLAE